MIKEFKNFLLRGNVIDLAVGIAIGVAFTTLVKTFGDNFVNPIVAAIGGDSSEGFGFTITDNPKTLVDIGAILNAVIIFVITMAVIYFVIVAPMQKLQALRKRGVEPEPEVVPEDIALLREIRDSLNRGAAGRP